MKITRSRKSLLCYCTAGLTLTALPLLADETDNWQASFSGSLLLNVSAKFRGHPADYVLTNPNAGGSGAVNYDNGYVGKDISGSSTLSTYWGYQNAGQVVTSGGNATGLNYQSTTLNPGQTSPSANADLTAGGEVQLRRALVSTGGGKLGVELGFSYHHADIKDAGSYDASGLRTSTTYATSAPYDLNLFPPAGYQGPYNGSGPLINPTGTTGAATAAPNAVLVSGTRQVDADLFGFRLGPYFEYPLCDSFKVAASAGGLLMVVNDQANWTESVAVNTAASSGYWIGRSSVSGDSLGVTGGFYVGVDAAWKFADYWSLVGGVKWLDAGTYTQKLGAGQVVLDLSQAVTFNLGLSYSF